MSALDKYLDGVAGQHQQATDLNRSLSVAIDKNPDEYARYVRLSQATGIDPDHLLQDQDTRQAVERKQKIGAFDFDALVKTNPKTAAWLSDPKNAGLAHDDADQLTVLEQVLRKGRDLGGSLAKGVIGSGAGSLLSGASQLLDVGARAIDRPIRAAFGDDIADLAWYRPMRIGDVPTDPFDALKVAGRNLKQIGQAVGAPVKRQGLDTDVAEGIGQLGFQISQFLLTGGTTAVAGLWAQGADVMADKTSKDNAPQANKDVATLAGGAITAVTEKYGIDKILNRVPPAIKNRTLRFLADTAAAGGIEAAQEVAEGLLHDVSRYILTNDNASEIGQGFTREATAAGLSAAIVRAALGVRGHRQAQQDQAFFEALGDATKNSKTLQRLPERAREVVAALHGEGQQNVYVDAKQAQAYFQSAGLDAVAFAEEVTGDPRQFQEAAALGGDWVIPMDAFAAKIAPTDHLQGLMADLRLRAGDLSQREAQLAEANRDPEQDQLQAMIADAQQKIDADAPAQAVYQDLYGQAIATGATPSTAQAWAAITAAHYRTRAARLGIPVADLWQQEGLTVTRPLPDVLARQRSAEPAFDSRLDMLRAGNVPADVDLAGELAQISQALGDLGIDLPTLTNEQVREALGQFMGETDGVVLDQQGDTDGTIVEGTQSNPTLFKGGDVKRGAYYPDKRAIALLEKADLSTFLHELGHHWLEGLRRDALRTDAPQQLRDDWQRTAKWLGIDPAGVIPVEAHEQWARGTESYFAEGKAPAFELRDLYRKFAAWVKSVYRDLAALNVKLTDEVRGVMDRLVATDDEIANAEHLQGYDPIFADAKAAGVTEAEWTALQSLREKARDAAEQQATAKIMRELKRENAAWWKSATEAMRDEVMKEAEAVPVYRAIHALSRGEFFDGTQPETPLKLSREALASMYGDEYLKNLSAQSLRTQGWVYAKEGGLHPDVVAPLFGFDSGDAFVKAMIEAQPMRQWIDAETKKRMLDRHGDMLNDGGLADEAMSAVHNDHQADLLMAELRLLNRRAKGGEITPAALLKDAARREIGRRRIESIAPDYYLRAERKAAREAFDAAAKQDFAAAAAAKQRQLLNLEFYRAARDARETVGREVAHLTELSKSKSRAKIGKAGQEWLDQLDAILARYSFAPMSLTARSRSLAEWYATINDPEGLNAGVAIAPQVLDESRRTNYRELSFDDFMAVADSVRSIEHVAKRITDVLRNGKAYALEQAIEEVERTVAASPMKDRQALRPGDEQTLADAIKDRTYTMLRPEKIFEWLDGTKSGGIFHDLFWNRATSAQVVHDDLKAQVMQPLQQLMDSIDPQQEARMQERIHIAGIGRSLSRYELIGIAMNVGNAGNRDKLMRGGIHDPNGLHQEIDEDLLAELLDPLSEADWKMVQTIWDTIGQLYPQMNELNQRVTGLPLAKVEALPVVTKYGPLAGGYWPAVGDPEYSDVGKRQEQAGATAADIFPSPFPNAATAHSFRKERTGAAYPLQFDWRKVLSRHVNQATTDIAYAEFVADANRLLNNTRIQSALTRKLGREQYQGLRDWLKHQVAAAMGGYNGTRSIDQTMNMALANASVAALGYKVATALGNLVVAPVQASHQVQGRYLGRGFWEYMKSPNAALEKVQALSGEMRHRASHIDATFNQVLDALAGKPSIRKTIMQQAMLIHTLADRIGTTGIWLGKYYQEFDRLSAAAQNETELAEAETEARQLADKTIRTTQTAGAPKDLSSFERDPKYAWGRMFLGPMLIMQNELRGAAITKQNVAMTLLATWIIPSVLFELAVGRGPDDDEDPAAWALRKIAIYPMQTVPFIRDAAAGIESLLTHKPAVTRSNPITDLMLQFVKASQKLMSDNADAGDKLAAALQAIGVATGMPGYAAGTAGNYLADLATGETQVNSPMDARYLFIKRDADRRD